MALHRGDEGAARFVALGTDPAVSVERKLGIDCH